MSDGADAGDDAIAEYGLGQFPHARRTEATDREQLREQYGRLRAYYRLEPDAHRDLKRWLNQARIGISYDVYLAASARYAIAATLGGVLAGLVLAGLLVRAGVTDVLAGWVGLDAAVVGQPIPVLTALGESLGIGEVSLLGGFHLFFGAAVCIAVATAAGLVVWYGRYYHPCLVARARARNIDVTLPHAIVLLYALSHGGMSLMETIDVISEKQDVYGEVANEFETVRREVELFGNDPQTALRNARTITPSDNFEQFVDDLLSTIDTGGDVSAFLQRASDTYLESARDERAEFMETLGLLAELFIATFVATPFFVIVMLLVMSLVGAPTLSELVVFVYLVIPGGMVAFLFVVDVLSRPYRQRTTEVARPNRTTATGQSPGTLLRALVRDAVDTTVERVRAVRATDDGSTDRLEQEARMGGYLRRQRRRQVRDLLDDPLVSVRNRPSLTLLVTVPAAALALGAMLSTGWITPSVAAVIADPVRVTSGLFVLPFLLVAVPLSVAHERQVRTDQRISRRFPNALHVLSGANKMGMSVTDALELASRWSAGPLAEELRRVRNEIHWSADSYGALVRLGDRLDVPQLRRSTTLIAEGMRSTSDLARVLGVAAEDTRQRLRLDDERRTELSGYVAIVVIGFLVYLLVVVLLDTAYIQEMAKVEPPTPPEGRSLPLTIRQVPVEIYETVLFHSALVQGLGVGLLAGKLSEDTLLGGLKYSIGLVGLTLLVFALV